MVFVFYDKKKRRSIALLDARSSLIILKCCFDSQSSIIGCRPKISPGNTDEKRTA